MLIHKLTIFIVSLSLSACSAPKPTQTGSDVPVDAPKEINWEKAKEMIFSGEIETIVQSHDRKVILEHENGSQFLTTEPELDDIIQIVKECGIKCSNLDIMSE